MSAMKPYEIQDLLRKGTYILFFFGPPLLILIYGMIVRHKDARKIRTFGWIFLVAAALFFAIEAPGFLSATGRGREASVKSSVHAIQIALERYAVDHDGVYPEKVQTLIDDEYISAFPFNPFYEEKRMEEVSYGSEDYEGNFTYIPVELDGKITSFYLLGYGSYKTDGEQLQGTPDHIVIVLNGFANPPEDTDSLLLQLLPEHLSEP
jgi:hypothetical protein